MEKNQPKKISLVVLSQLTAVFVQNLILLSIGMSLGFVTILIAGLSDQNSGNDVTLNDEEQSWIGSILLISCLLGCSMSGITELFGKIRIMQIIMIPFFLSWIVLYISNNVWQIYLTLIVIGIASGVVEASVLSYIAEIAQPHLRGMFSASTTLSMVFGILLEYLIGTSLNWRVLALLSGFFPIITFISLCFMPESPQWLVAKNNSYQARKSLAWLRGWVSIEDIEKEFENLYGNQQIKIETISYSTFDRAIEVDFYEEKQAPKKKSLIKLFFKKNFLRPFAIVAFLFFLVNFSGSLALQTYGIKIMNSLLVPINSYYAMLLMGIANFLGALTCILVVRYLGKRLLLFLSMLGVIICSFGLGIYAFLNNIKNIEFSEYSEQEDANIFRWIPLVLMVLIAFSAFFGLTSLPWMLTGEVYTYETRAIATGLTSAVYFISGFLSNKVFFDMISQFYLFGVFWFYGCVSLLGLIVNYFVLPETEGRTLQEITNHFSGVLKLNNKIQRCT